MFRAGGIRIINNPNLVSLDGVFPRLQTVGLSLRIWQNSHLETIEGSFPQLQIVGDYLEISYNGVLTSIDRSFQSVQTVGNCVPPHVTNTPLLNGGCAGGYLRFDNNWLLTSIGSSFSSIQSVGGLMFYTNGDNAAFCASVRTLLCPTTFPGTSNWQNGGSLSAYQCCTAYCQTTTAC